MKQKEKPILSIALLVSNRWKTIRQCLDSLAPIREAVPSELIILDTGCDPELHELLVSYADKIECFEWCKDFSKARNVTIDLAEGEWYMFLDDDEWFTETTELIDFFQSGKYKNYGYANYIQRNYLDNEGTQYTDCWVGRMIKLEKDTRFKSKIHEYLAPLRGNYISLHAVVDHYGYVYENEEAKQKHFERNYVLLKEMIEEEPKEVRWKLQILQEFRTVDRHQDMIDYGIVYMKDLEKEYKIIPGVDAGENHALGVYYASIILGAAGQKDHKTVVEWCEKIRKDERLNELAKALGELTVAKSYFYLAEYENSIKACENYLEYDRYFSIHQKELLSFQRSPLVSTAFDIVKYKEIYSLLICSGLKLGDTSYLGIYMEKLEWDKKSIYVFEEIADTIIEASCKLGYREEFYRLMKIIHNHGALSRYFDTKICEWRQERFDTTAIETVEEWGRQYTIKKQLLDILGALDKVNAMIGMLINMGNTTELTGILTEAQNVAITLGTAIEKDYGVGTKAVGLLEEYCEVVWRMNEAALSIIDQSNVASQEYKEKQQAALLHLMELIQQEKAEIDSLNQRANGIRQRDLTRKEMVFFPYKASMWDSLESVWKTACEDENCDAYVVPIPYFDRKADGSFGEMHYEGDLFPEYVPVISWEEYEFEARRPDVMYIHNPYDQYNLVTSVHPRFYAANIKQYTKKLVYIPYFIHQNDYVPEYHCYTAGVHHADLVILQSEKVREQYIKYYGAYAKITDQEFLEKKFVGWGSPKLDGKGFSGEIPEEWKSFLIDSKKKVIFFNTHLSGVMQENCEDFLKKLEWVFEVAKNQDSVVWLWRPHPLTLDTIRSMNPVVEKAYLDLVEKYKSEKIGIYDDTPDLHRAIEISDAYYGSGSSVAEIFRQQGKPVMYMDVTIRD